MRSIAFCRVVSTIVILSLAVPCRAATRTVAADGSGEFATIQAAVDAFASGDTVVVMPGLYQEDVDVYRNSITLTSVDPQDQSCMKATVVNGYIVSGWDNVTVRGFTTRGMLRWVSPRYDAIEVSNVTGSGEWVVWMQIATGSEELSLRAARLSDGSVRVLSSQPSYCEPRISGDTVVWRELRNGRDGIYGQKLSSGQEFVACEPAIAPSELAISGNMIAWRDGSGAILARDLASGEQFLAGTGYHVDVSGDVVAWWGQDANSVNRIRCRNIRTGHGWAFGPVGLMVEPKISGDFVVWMEDGFVKGIRLSTHDGFVVAAIEGTDAEGLNIEGRAVTWQERRYIENWGTDTVMLMKDVESTQPAIVIGRNHADSGAMPACDGNNLYYGSYIRRLDYGEVTYIPSLYVRGIYLDSSRVGRDTYGGICLMGRSPTAQNNIASGCGGAFAGMYPDGVCSDNIIEDCAIGLEGVYGRICGNRIERCWLAGIYNGGGQISDNVVAHCGGDGMTWCSGAIVNNTIVNNDGNGVSQATGVVRNNIIAYSGGYGLSGVGTHSYNCLWQNGEGPLGTDDAASIGEFGADPLFADMAGGDYHLMSRAGRWDPLAQAWVMDSKTSVCIDAGDPADAVCAEPSPNGGRIDVGMYGGSAQASLSERTATCLSLAQTDINCDCRVDWRDMGLVFGEWLADSSRQIPQSLGRTLVVAAGGTGQYLSIQDAIDNSQDLDTIVVMPGIYPEDVWFNGRAITVRGSEPNDPNTVHHTVINGTVYFVNNERENCVLSGLTVVGQIGPRLLEDCDSPIYLYRGTLVMRSQGSGLRKLNLISGKLDQYYYRESDIIRRSELWDVELRGNSLYVSGDGAFYYEPIATAVGELVAFDISGETVAWVDEVEGTNRIYTKRLGDSEASLVGTGSGWCIDVRIIGDMVIWSLDGNILGVNTATGEQFAEYQPDAPIAHFDVAGDVLVWEKYMPDRTFDCYARNLRTGEESVLAGGGGEQYYPRICGNRVAWAEWRGWSEPGSLIVKDLATGEQVTLAEIDPYGLCGFDISGDTILWGMMDQSWSNLLGLYWRPLTPSIDLVTTRKSRGIVCAGTSPTITGNFISDSTGAGISCRNGAAPLIAGNEVRRCLDGGIKGSAGEIRGNTIMDCDANGLSGCAGPVTNNVIAFNGDAGLMECTGTVTNNTIFGHTYDSVYPEAANVTNNIIGAGWMGPWGPGSYNCYWQMWMGSYTEGEFSADPKFVDAEGGDFHLRSEYGRWDTLSSQWVTDDVTSPCIDAGDPTASVGSEPNPNGGRRNMGAYGGTPQASKSAGAGPEPLPYCTQYSPADLNRDCVVNLTDYAIFAAAWAE